MHLEANVIKISSILAQNIAKMVSHFSGCKCIWLCLFPIRLLATVMLFAEVLNIFLVLHQFIQDMAAQLLTTP